MTNDKLGYMAKFYIDNSPVDFKTFIRTCNKRIKHGSN